MAARNGRSTNPFEDDLDEYEFEHAVSKLEQTQNRILGSTSRSLGLIEDSHNIAIKTAEELQRQEETLNRTERTLDDTRQNMVSANRHIKSVNSIWGAIGNYFSKPSNTVPTSATKHETGASKLPPKKTLHIEKDLQLDYGEESFAGSSKGRGTDAFQRQYNSQLDEISRGLSILKDDALILGETVDRHDGIIERVHNKVEIVEDEVRGADKRVRRILRR